MKALRLPARAYLIPYLLRLQAPRAPPMFVFAEALLMSGRLLVRPGSLVSRRPIFRHAAPWAWAGYHRFPGDPSYAFALLQDPGRSGRTSPLAVLPTPPPVGPDRRHPRAHYIEAKRRALASAVYASRATSPPLVQDSLPAGGLRLCREGVEPSGSLRKVSGHILPPFQDFVLSQGP